MTCKKTSLRKLGWDNNWENIFKNYSSPELIPARVMAAHRSHYQLQTEQGPCTGEVSGRMRYDILHAAGFPVTGDWVGVLPNSQGSALIKTLLPRRSSFERWEENDDKAQVLAANVDCGLVFQSSDRFLNLGGLERMLSMIWDGGAFPAIIITKSDLLSAQEVVQIEAKLIETFPGVEVLVTSAYYGWGFTELQKLMHPGKTYAALGYSGAGKSTILNYLLGEEKSRTQNVREGDSRGRHTTTSRSLFLLPGGAIYLDTPGIREIGLYSHGSVESAFSDIMRIAEKCRFNNCLHQEEPGCAVKEALEEGKLDKKRWEGWVKLQKEKEIEEHKKRKARRKMSKAKTQRKKVHYKDFVRGGYEIPEE